MERCPARGERLWNHNYYGCHGLARAVDGLSAPDLRESAAAHDPKTLRTILRDGALSSGGMPKFDEYTDEDIRAVQMYIRKISTDTHAGTNSISQ